MELEIKMLQTTLKASDSPISGENLIDIADKALYFSKEHGRNKITHSNQNKYQTLAQSFKKQ